MALLLQFIGIECTESHFFIVVLILVEIRFSLTYFHHLIHSKCFVLVNKCLHLLKLR